MNQRLRIAPRIHETMAQGVGGGEGRARGNRGRRRPCVETWSCRRGEPRLDVVPRARVLRGRRGVAIASRASAIGTGRGARATA